MSQVSILKDADFEREVLQCDCLAVVDFGAAWCGPCKKLHPIIGELAEEFDRTVKFFEMDVGETPYTAQKYAVISVPQLLFFQNGSVVERIVGLLPKPKIKEKIEQALKG